MAKGQRVFQKDREYDRSFRYDRKVESMRVGQRLLKDKEYQKMYDLKVESIQTYREYYRRIIEHDGWHDRKVESKQTYREYDGRIECMIDIQRV